MSWFSIYRGGELWVCGYMGMWVYEFKLSDYLFTKIVITLERNEI